MVKTSTRRFLQALLILVIGMASLQAVAQTNPLWSQKKVKNYLPHMTSPEVAAFLEKSDMVIIPVASQEQHGNHLPIGTDFINGVERCKLIAQERDILVAPVLMVGQSPYHMGFPGTMTLSADLIIKVHLEAVESLIRHGFKRFIIMNAHGGTRRPAQSDNGRRGGRIRSGNQAFPGTAFSATEHGTGQAWRNLGNIELPLPHARSRATRQGGHCRADAAEPFGRNAARSRG